MLNVTRSFYEPLSPRVYPNTISPSSPEPNSGAYLREVYSVQLGRMHLNGTLPPAVTDLVHALCFWAEFSRTGYISDLA
jgi:hypothetical protein